MAKTKKFYLSTALPYVNAQPHIGFALEAIQADAVARYHRFLGEEVFFLTGTDENSLKNVKAAEKAGISVKELVGRNAAEFYKLKQALNLSFDDFIRTSEKRHRLGVERLWTACQKDIYKKKYKGLYCVGCEEFYRESELDSGLCPEHKRKLEVVEEENFFFRLSKYQGKLKEIIEKGRIEIIPQERKREVLGVIKQGLEDICISRSVKRAHGWGIRTPGDSGQIVWVWFDALANYITALGYAEGEQKFQEFWQENENKLHIIGKGISRFHCLYWPAMLLSAGLSLPKTIFIHGYITVGKEKMSKSLGNVVSPFDLVERYGTDPVRYFFLREIPPSEDGDFTIERFESRYNTDLANGLGNLTSRVIALSKKLKITPSLEKEFGSKEVRIEAERAYRNSFKALERFSFNRSLEEIWSLINFSDRYIERERPWEAKNKQVIADLLFILSEIAKMLEVFLPETSKRILEQIETGQSKVLFPRI